MTVGAMLAKDLDKRVLVLERAPFIGGRTLSFVGKGRKVVADGLEMDVHEFRKALGHASCLLGKCTPDIETIFEKGLLDGWTFEAGGTLVPSTWSWASSPHGVTTRPSGGRRASTISCSLRR